ncbi:MAG: hypothetical protein V5B31_02235 [Candidatus Accumulibacter propinquus]|jgi:hypothetical protein|uniref:hypothetical protein n=1 Tax=Candidatus Accumulibacter propinquus TaxID=2954380 RepID=UPI002FC3284A
MARLMGLDGAVGMPLLALALLIAVGLGGGLVVHGWLAFWRVWSAFWHAVALRCYLHRPWRAAWDKARRRAS